MAGDQNKFRVAMTHAERFSQQGNWAEASKAYRFALAEYPNSEAAIVGFGKATLHLGSPEQAWRAFQQALKINPNSTTALSYMADIQAQMGRADPAAQTYLRVGNIFASKKNIEAGLEAWQKAVELIPDFPEAHRNLAHGLAQLGETRLAARQFLTLASIYQRKNDMAHAAQQIEAARQLLPNEPGVETAIVALKQGHLVEPDMVSETEPPPPFLVPPDEPEEEDIVFELEPESEDEDEDDFSSEDELEDEDDFPQLLVPDDEPYESPSLMMPPDDIEVIEADEEIEDEEIVEDDLFAEDALDDFFDDDEPDSSQEEDVFDFDTAPTETSHGGLIESARQKALAELANIIFEDDQSGPESSVLPDGTEVSLMEINMMVIQAIDLQARGDIDDAIDRYRQVVQANAGRPALHYNLGLLYKEQENYPEAIRLLRMASPDPDFQLCVQYALGQTYYASGEPERTLTHFTEVLKTVDLETIDDERYDELETFYDNFAEGYLADDDVGKMDNFVKAIEHFFDSSDWKKKVKDARRRMDQISEDEVMSLAAFLESPETEVVITALAATNEYMEKGLPMSASEECLRAIQRAPSYLPLHTRLADILLKRNKTDSAINKYLAVANVYEARRQGEQAVGVFNKILRIAPLDVTVRTKLIDLQITRNKIEPALENYLALADSYYQLAQVDLALAKYEEALQLAAQSETQSSWKIKIFNQTGDIYNQRFDWNKATSYFEQAYQLDPTDERTSRQLVDLYYKQGKTSQAIRVLDGLLAIYHKHNPTEAISFLKELVAINSDDMFLRQRLAISYMQAGNRQGAIAEYDVLGEMQLNQGMKSQATQTIQTILKLKPESPESYRQLLEQIKSGEI